MKRSLRYYAHSGLLRLNFATAIAKNKSNPGGLQHHYSTREHRQAAHNYVLHSLACEFPELLSIDPASPNGCKFARDTVVRSGVCNGDPATAEVVVVCDDDEQTPASPSEARTLQAPRWTRHIASAKGQMPGSRAAPVADCIPGLRTCGTTPSASMRTATQASPLHARYVQSHSESGKTCYSRLE